MKAFESFDGTCIVYEQWGAHCRAVHRSTIALAEIAAPTLVIAGEEDPLAARPEVLVGAIPDATLLRVPGDHQQVVSTPQFARGIVQFLASANPGSAR